MAIFKRKKEEDKSKESSKKTDKKKDVSMKDLYSSGTDSKEKKKGVEKASKKDASKDSKKEPQKTPQTAYRIILKPLMTEKVNNLGTENKYVFQVAKNTNKVEVAKAIKEIYNVSPEKVNIINMKGKSVRFGRLTGQRSDWKKAVVKIPKGKTISVHEGV